MNTSPKAILPKLPITLQSGCSLTITIPGDFCNRLGVFKLHIGDLLPRHIRSRFGNRTLINPSGLLSEISRKSSD